MKRVILVIVLINLFIATGCGLTRVDPAEGKQITKSLMEDRKKGNLDNLGDYYLSTYLAQESVESMAEKLRKIEEVAGRVQSYELVKEEQFYDEGTAYHQLVLEYKVKCDRTTLRETYIVVKDEGRTGILAQDTQNWEMAE